MIRTEKKGRQADEFSPTLSLGETDKELSLSWFEALDATLIMGTYVAAGTRLGCHHTTVSRNVANLEQWFGIKVFAKGPNGPLTPEGAHLSAIGYVLLSQIRTAKNKLPFKELTEKEKFAERAAARRDLRDLKNYFVEVDAYEKAIRHGAPAMPSRLFQR